MSFAIPRNTPSFDPSRRQLENRIWSAAGMSTASPTHSTKANSLRHQIQSTVGEFLSPTSSNGPLPLYKDKPFDGNWQGKPERGGRGRQGSKFFVLTGLGVFAWLVYRFVVDPLWQDMWLQTSNGQLSPEEQRVQLHWEVLLNGEPDSTVSSVSGWKIRRDLVVRAFQESWDTYVEHGWGQDIFHPVQQDGEQMSPEGLGWIIIDSLDTLILMNQTSRLAHARHWLRKSLTWDQDQDVNTFETTIRMLGGLLGAHYLSTEFPHLSPLTGEEDRSKYNGNLYLDKAKDLADRLLGAFDSPSGIPYASVNLHTKQGIESHADGGASSTAEAATLHLEFKYLAKLTGDIKFWTKVENVTSVIDSNHPPGGLVPIFISPETGKFRGNNIRLGSRGDSYYEYLIKQYLQTNQEEPVYLSMWDETLQGIRDHLVTYTKEHGFTIIAERPNGLDGRLVPKMDHLVCFLPGTIALGATRGLTLAEAKRQPWWSKQNEDDLTLARETMLTCWGMYKAMKTGLAPEITHFYLPEEITELPEGSQRKFNTRPSVQPPIHLEQRPLSDGGVVDGKGSNDKNDNHWTNDFYVKSADKHNLQRPETVESLWYMWRITGDPIYREWGWEMFRSFIQHTQALAPVEELDIDPENIGHKAGTNKGGGLKKFYRVGGFTSLQNVDILPPKLRDNMESFWLAETLKYFYLLFSEPGFLPYEKMVWNTEAHPLPVFPLDSQLQTGWTRAAPPPPAITESTSYM